MGYDGDVDGGDNGFYVCHGCSDGADDDDGGDGGDDVGDRDGISFDAALF